MGRDSSVGIENRYWMDGPEIEICWGSDFPYSSILLFNGYPKFAGVKRPGRGVEQPFPYSAEVKGRILFCEGHIASCRVNFAEAFWPMIF